MQGARLAEQLPFAACIQTCARSDPPYSLQCLTTDRRSQPALILPERLACRAIIRISGHRPRVVGAHIRMLAQNSSQYTRARSDQDEHYAKPHAVYLTPLRPRERPTFGAGGGLRPGYRRGRRRWWRWSGGASGGGDGALADCPDTVPSRPFTPSGPPLIGSWGEAGSVCARVRLSACLCCLLSSQERELIEGPTTTPTQRDTHTRTPGNSHERIRGRREDRERTDGVRAGRMRGANGCYAELHRSRHIVATIGAHGGVVGQAMRLAPNMR